MSYLDASTTHINGPINVIRLEGKINQITKVIYLFMDVHVSLEDQTHCDNIFAQDITQYLVTNLFNIKESDRIYDFFFEIYPTMSQLTNNSKLLDNEKVNHRDIYIREISRLFQKIFSFDSTKNKVALSNIFKNVRLHYMDVRDYFEYDIRQKMDSVTLIVNKMIHFNSMQIDKIIAVIVEIKKDFLFILERLDEFNLKKYQKNPGLRLVRSATEFENQNDNMSIEEKKTFSKKYMSYLINKMFNVYKNDSVKSKLLPQFDYIVSYLKSVIDSCEEMIDDFSNIVDNYEHNKYRLTKENVSGEYNYGLSTYELNNTNTHIINTWSNNHDRMVDFFTRFMDVYFLRRFLDKEYITNVIAYTGSYHSDVYINILVKDFNFKITHCAYSSISDLTELNREVKNKNVLDLPEIFYPKFFTQCSDVSHFPENFK